MDSKNKIITNASGGASASVSDALGNVLASSYIADVSWNSETRVLSCLGASGNVIGSVEIPSRQWVDDPTLPLTLRAVEDNSSVTLNKVGDYGGIVLYKRDVAPNVGWTRYTFGTAINLNAGEYVCFKTSGPVKTKTSSVTCRFSMTGKIEAWHDINSMAPTVASIVTGFETLDLTVANNAYAFSQLFMGCTSLAKPPLLPATALGTGTYRSLFSGCTGLTQAPELPATTLANNCYQSMFNGCTGLVQAPSLPATTLAQSCYSDMFYGCTGLVKAPALPATTLVDSCYYQMFSNCTGLTQAPELPATTLEEQCCQSMFYGCTGLVKAPALPATTLAKYCYQYMFYGCTGLTQAPELPATTLAQSCYLGMFQGCSSLNAVTCRATNISASLCTASWLGGVAASGDFYTPQATSWGSGASGIPNGWTRHDI